MTTVSVLVPIDIGTAQLLSSSIAEPIAADVTYNGKTYALKENAWASGTAYAVGDRVFRASTHKIYECQLAAPSSRTLPPESDGQYWIELGPTQRYAPFDTITNTKAYGSPGPITYSVQVGFCNAICFFGLDGGTLQVQGYTDTVANGGTLFYDSGQIAIQEPAFDEYDWLFGQIYPMTSYVISGLLPYPNARFDITITGTFCSVGTIAFGDLASLVPSDPNWAGPNIGAEAQPHPYSYVKVNDDGTVKITRRFAATDLHFELQVPIEAADVSMQIVRRVLDVPAAWVCTDIQHYSGLTTFGIASGKLAYDLTHAIWTFDVTGTT